MSRRNQKYFLGAICVLMFAMPSAAQSSSASTSTPSGSMNGNNNSYSTAYSDDVNVSAGIAVSNYPTTNEGSDSWRARKTGRTGASNWGPVLHPYTGAQKSLSSGWSEKRSNNTGLEALNNFLVSQPAEKKAISSSLRHSSEKHTAILRNLPQVSASESGPQIGKTLGGQTLDQRRSALTSGLTRSGGNSSTASSMHGASLGSTGRATTGENKGKTAKNKGLFSGSKEP
jgi:hypothetical protein